MWQNRAEKWQKPREMEANWSHPCEVFSENPSSTLHPPSLPNTNLHPPILLPFFNGPTLDRPFPVSSGPDRPVPPSFNALTYLYLSLPCPCTMYSLIYFGLPSIMPKILPIRVRFQ